MVDRIIRLTVQTGLVTSVVATLDLIFFLAFPTGLHLMFNFPLCKLYSNSLMSSLNARRSWKFGSSRQGSSDVYSDTVNLEILLTSNVPTSPRTSQAISPRDPPLRSIGGSYDNFSSNGSPFTSHEQVRSDASSATVPLYAINLGKGVRSDMVELHELRSDMIDSRRQDSLSRSPSPTQRTMDIALSVVTEMTTS